MSENPYAAPMAKPNSELPPPGMIQGVWRDGNLLVVHKNAQLPYRCVKTNEPAARKLNRKFYWHSPILFLLILLHILIYAVVALITRKKHELEVPVSTETDSRRSSGILLGWGIAGVGLALFVGGIVFAAASQRGDTWLAAYFGMILGGVIVMLVGLVVGSKFANILAPKKMTEHATWFKGAGPDFVRSFPQVPPMPK